MLVPVSWLKEFVDVKLPADQLAERLTLAGMEVAGIERVGAAWDRRAIVVGRILAVQPHPNADRLVLVDVDYGGSRPERVITGAPNVCAYLGKKVPPDLKAPFARVGAVLIDAYSDQRPRPSKELKPAKIRGVESRGMICSELELGLSEEHEGVLFLSPDAPVGAPLQDYLGDDVLDLDLTPDMGRCLSIYGVAREVSALTGVPLRPLDTSCAEFEGDAVSDFVDVEIADPDLCHRYIGAVIRDVTIGPSPGWLQDRLRKVGVRPVNNVVDITNYVLFELGQPLHAFDYDVLMSRAKKAGAPRPKVCVRRGKPGEMIVTLDGTRREVDDSVLLITDSAGPIALAGVMGGGESEIHDRTRNILLESATFHPVNNRRTAQRFKLVTESSRRFTWGIPPTLNVLAAARAANLIRDLAGGRIVPGCLDQYPRVQPDRVVYTSRAEISRQLGEEVPVSAIVSVLEKLGFEVEQVPADALPGGAGEAAFGLCLDPQEPVLQCAVPWYRLDVELPADLTEEFVRVRGFDEIEPTLLADALPDPRRNLLLETEEKVRDSLVSAGLQETINYTSTSPENHDKLRLFQQPAGSTPKTTAAPVSYVTIANPVSVQRTVMRRSMLVSAVENLAYNTRYTDRLAVFEIGRVYLPVEGEDLPREDRRLSVLLFGPRRGGMARSGEDEPELDFFDLKGVLEMLLVRMRFPPEEIQFVARQDHPTFSSRCAEIHVDGQAEGVLGELHPQVQAEFGLPGGRVCLAELRIEPLFKRSAEPRRMAPISPYPAVLEDLAFVVTETVAAADVSRAIRDAGGNLLSGVELFDVYRGEAVSAGRKSLAFRLCYQSMDATLSDSEIAAVRERVIEGVRKSVGGTLRA